MMIPRVFRPGQVVYLSGPMTGRQGFNYRTFHEYADALRLVGCVVINPAESFRGDLTLPRHRYMERAVRDVLKAHCVAVLPDWRESKGARVEVLIAQEIGIPVHCIDTGERIIERVETLITDPRALHPRKLAMAQEFGVHTSETHVALPLTAQ